MTSSSDMPDHKPPPVEATNVTCLCGYNLTGVPIGGRCPECGAVVRPGSYHPDDSAEAGVWSITSLVLGVISIIGGVCVVPGLLFGVAAITMGLMMRRTAPRGSATRQMAMSGVMLGMTGVAVSILVVLAGPVGV